MIPSPRALDQSSLELLVAFDPLVMRYRAFFALFDWDAVFPSPSGAPGPGQPAHPEIAYIKALLVKICEHQQYMTQLRRFLIEHPLLVLELGFHPVADEQCVSGFDPQQTVPCARWLRHKQRTLDRKKLHALLQATITALQAEIPGLGEVVSFDVKHLYAWVQENNPRVHLPYRFATDRRPKGDPDCRVGVKKCSNHERDDGSTSTRKEYLWGYGSGVASALIAGYGDVVLAEYTQPFNQRDIPFFKPLFAQTVANLGHVPRPITADAAFDAWSVYESVAHHGGIAAVPRNSHAAQTLCRDADATPLCAKGLRMVPTFQQKHTNGYRAQRFVCPLLKPKPTGESCDHEQFVKGKGCIKDTNIEKGGLMRVMLDRTGPLYHAIFTQRTSVERINSQAQADGIERPKVRNGRSVAVLNTFDLSGHQCHCTPTSYQCEPAPVSSNALAAGVFTGLVVAPVAQASSGCQKRAMPRSSSECWCFVMHAFAWLPFLGEFHRADSCFCGILQMNYSRPSQAGHPPFRRILALPSGICFFVTIL